MAETPDLKKLVKQLQGSKAPPEMINILRVLKTDFVVTEAILRESKAGLAVGKLRTHDNKEVADLAKDLVKKWKNEVGKDKQTTNKGGKPALAALKKAPAVASGTTPSTPTAPKFDARTAKTDGIDMSITKDDIRDKCIILIYDALAGDSPAPSELIKQRAMEVEAAVHKDLNGTTTAYKAKIRSLYVNLKDKNNPGLRESVVSGIIAAGSLATMSSADMASEERKAADQKIAQDNLFKTLGAGEPEAETDAFQCGRCKQRKCRYRQAQTRSADEPMTTFVTCVNCNNRWKFS
ncbi:transcription factor S-II, central domain-containing protein [Mycena floridula]|nr:transcription factor S-II, central domain-containing protein [Mycena floridula]